VCNSPSTCSVKCDGEAKLCPDGKTKVCPNTPCPK
jgi:hypothetical protein